MPDDTFFQDTIETPAAEADVIKVGDKEYSQEDLSKLVGLGEIAKEAEEKWNTPINKVFPEYTKATQELKALKAEQAAKLNPEPTPIQSNTNGLTEEQRQEAIRQLKDLGFVSREEAQQTVQAQLAAKDLIGDVNKVISGATDAGNPVTTTEELLTHMQETGIKNPQKAYRDMFETELDAIKEKKLATIKPGGMVTTEASTAGSKQPTNIKVTRANLGQIVADALGGQG